MEWIIREFEKGNSIKGISSLLYSSDKAMGYKGTKMEAKRTVEKIIFDYMHREKDLNVRD